MPYPHNEEKLEKWKKERAQDILRDRAPWDVYDAQIMVVVNTYNSFLKTTPGFVSLDWQIIKAQIWVETGVNSKDWRTLPMQIGKDPRDGGLHQILETPSG